MSSARYLKHVALILIAVTVPLFIRPIFRPAFKFIDRDSISVTESAAVTDLILKEAKNIFDNLFVISLDKIVGNNVLQQEEIIKLGSLENNYSLFDYLTSDLKVKLQSSSWIDEVSFQLAVLPVRLSVSVKEAQPWLIAEYKNNSWLVSKSGQLIQTIDKLKNKELAKQIVGLPRLYGLEIDSELTSLKSENLRFSHAIQLLQLVQESGGFPFGIDKYRFLNDGAIEATPVEIGKYPLVVFNSDRPLDRQGEGLSDLAIRRSKLGRQFSQLANVVADLEKRQEVARKVDLRFNNQVVVTGSTGPERTIKPTKLLR